MAMTEGLKAGTPKAGTSGWSVAAYTVGLVFVFAGERVFSTITPLRMVLSGSGAAAILATTVLRWISAGSAMSERRTVERAMALLSTGGALAVALYFSTTEAAEARLGIDAWSPLGRQRFESVVTVLWVAMTLGTLLPMLFAERALFPMRRSARVEWRRVRDAMTAGLTLALAATYGAMFTFVASELEWKADFSYFHTARPSESTRKLAASATEPIDLLAFFPDVSPVGAEVGAYLRELSHASSAIHVEQHDRLLFPELAKKANVFIDGVVVIQRGAEKESLSFPMELTAARPKLKSLDIDFQKGLLKILRARRTAYFTVGHGELNDTQPSPQNEGRTGKAIREVLEHQNYVVRDLGAATGLTADVPEDASLVLVIGPSQPFLPEEVSALGRYAEKGGHLLLALDPEAKVSPDPLAALVGLKVSSSILANDKVHLRHRFNDSDRTLIVTNRFSSHSSVSTLSRVASRPVVLGGAGWLEQRPGSDPALHVDFAMRALPDTFADEDGNFAFDANKEHRQAYALAAAVTKAVAHASDAPSNAKKSTELRAFVVADADVVSDAMLGNEANVLLVADAVRWLGGDESIAGTLSTPEDVRIEHTKQKDLVWFYGVIFAAPALVLGLGLIYTRRSRQRRRPSAPTSAPVGGQGATA